MKFKRNKRIRQDQREMHIWIAAWAVILIVFWLGSLLIIGESFIHQYFLKS